MSETKKSKELSKKYDSDTERLLLIEQYRRCAEDWRHFDKLLWQIPFTTATVVGTLLAIIYGSIGEVRINLPKEAKILLLNCLMVFVFVMFFLARKIRFFQECRTAFMEQIKEMPVITSECIKYLRKIGITKKIVNYRAVHFQNFLYISYVIALSYLIIQEGIFGVFCMTLVGISMILIYFYDEIAKKLHRLFNNINWKGEHNEK